MNNYPWTTAIGAWGDSICAYGNICKLLKERNEEKANIVFFGLDQNICELFKAQDNIAKVEWLRCDPPFLTGKYIQLAHENSEEWHKVTEVNNVIPEINFTHLHNQEPYRDFDCKLPSCLADWEQFLESKRPYIIFQPYSTQSCDYKGHWPYWKESLRFLIENSDDNIVVIGDMPDSEIDNMFDTELFEHQKVICLLGETKTMIDVLHIATRAKMIVGTCNALAYWAILKKIPSLIVCNNIIKTATPYYYKWLDYKGSLLDHDVEFDRFVTCFNILNNTL